jgi:hypothetical protein
MAQNMEEVNAILQFAQITQTAGPEGMAVLKVGAMLDEVAEKLGIPQKIRNSPEERRLIMQQAAQAASQMAEQNPEAAGQMIQGMM